MEVEAPAAGTLKQIAKAGETYQVGDTIGEIS
jgi:pyruvate/2-oxoglutarate dehydrogenase complex dihydrolipoamide acyltransferase (E2) component